MYKDITSLHYQFRNGESGDLNITCFETIKVPTSSLSLSPNLSFIFRPQPNLNHLRVIMFDSPPCLGEVSTLFLLRHERISRSHDQESIQHLTFHQPGLTSAHRLHGWQHQVSR